MIRVHSGIFQLIAFDQEHDGFASDGIDAEPTVRWPKRHFLYEIDPERARTHGPPLYGVSIEEAP